MRQMGASGVFWDCIQHVRGLADLALAGEPDAPFVSVGGASNQRPAEFLVRELVEDVTFSDRSTSAMGRSGARGCYRVEFAVACEAWCRRPTLAASSEAVQRWMQLLFERVAADKTLGGLCVHAEPYVGRGGTALDTNKLYTSAFDFGIRVSAEIDPARDLDTKE